MRTATVRLQAANTLPRGAVSQTIDVARVVAVSAIFYFHVGQPTHYPLSHLGKYAVGFFIVLAGITYLVFSRTHASDLGSYVKYLGNRIAALFPVFLAVNVLLFAASHVYPSDLGRPFTMSELALSCLGISEYLGYRFLSQAMWFVPFILQVYLLLPLMVWLLSRVRPMAVLTGAFGLSFLLTETVFALYPANALRICYLWSPVFRLPEVLLGVFLGRWITQGTRASDAIAFFAVYLGASGSFILLSTENSHPNAGWVLALPWSGLVLGVLIVLTAVLIRHGLRWTAVGLNYRLFGAASFSFFLIHGPAIGAVYAKVGANTFAWLLYFVLCWIGAVIMAAFDGQWRIVAFAKHRERGSIRMAPPETSLAASRPTSPDPPTHFS